MKKLFILTIFFVLTACAPHKPPLDDTQVVDGKSIIVPPNFDKLPKEK